MPGWYQEKEGKKKQGREKRKNRWKKRKSRSRASGIRRIARLGWKWNKSRPFPKTQEGQVQQGELAGVTFIYLLLAVSV